MPATLAAAIADATATLKAENDRALAQPGSAENPSPFVFGVDRDVAHVESRRAEIAARSPVREAAGRLSPAEAAIAAA